MLCVEVEGRVDAVVDEDDGNEEVLCVEVEECLEVVIVGEIDWLEEVT